MIDMLAYQDTYYHNYRLLPTVWSSTWAEVCCWQCVQAVMADELGQVRMQLQLEKDALERARSQRAADRCLLFCCVVPHQRSNAFICDLNVTQLLLLLVTLEESFAGCSLTSHTSMHHG